MMIELIEVGSNVVEEALRHGAEQAEAFLTETRMITVTMEKGSIKTCNLSSDSGVGIRVFHRGSQGMAYATMFNSERISEMVERAVKQAKAGTPDPDFRSLPEPEPTRDVGGVYDGALAKADVSDIIDLVVRIGEASKIDDRVYSINVNVSAGWQRVSVVNSLGVSCEDKSTLIGISADVTVSDRGEMTSGHEEQVSRSFKGVDPEWVGEEASKHGIKSLGAKKLKTATLPVVTDSFAAGYIISGAFGISTNAEFVQRGRSYLCGKLGEVIGCDQLTILDDGTLQAGLASLKIDAEGTPSKKNMIVEKGVLKSYEYDSYSARKEMRESTGNCVRAPSGIGFWNYRERPFISTRNLMVKPGRGKVEDLISEVMEGVLLRVTYDLPNFTTGEFSGLMAEAYMIKNGEIVYPIKQTNLGVNMIDFFKGIDAVGSDFRSLVAVGVDMVPRSIVTPSFRVARARISSAY